MEECVHDIKNITGIQYYIANEYRSKRHQLFPLEANDLHRKSGSRELIDKLYNKQANNKDIEDNDLFKINFWFNDLGYCRYNNNCGIFFLVIDLLTMATELVQTARERLSLMNAGTKFIKFHETDYEISYLEYVLVTKICSRLQSLYGGEDFSYDDTDEFHKKTIFVKEKKIYSPLDNNNPFINSNNFNVLILIDGSDSYLSMPCIGLLYDILYKFKLFLINCNIMRRNLGYKTFHKCNFFVSFNTEKKKGNKLSDSKNNLITVQPNYLPLLITELQDLMNNKSSIHEVFFAEQFLISLYFSLICSENNLKKCHIYIENVSGSKNDIQEKILKKYFTNNIIEKFLKIKEFNCNLLHRSELGETEKNIQNIFYHEKKEKKIIILVLYNLDSLLEDKASMLDTGSYYNRILSTLLTNIDGIMNNATEHLRIISTGKLKYEHLPPAIKRPGRINIHMKQF